MFYLNVPPYEVPEPGDIIIDDPDPDDDGWEGYPTDEEDD